MKLINLYLNSQTKPITKEADVLLVTGDGKTLIEDLKAFAKLGIPYDVCSMGRSIQAIDGKVLHYADIDADNDFWVLDNLERNHPAKVPECGYILKHTLGAINCCHVDWDIRGCPWPMADVMWHGSTALFAAIIGLEMGYKNIVLAGCPLDSKGHWYFQEQDYGPRWTQETYQAWFEFAATEDAGKVKSMSGYTAQLLGRP